MVSFPIFGISAEEISGKHCYSGVNNEPVSMSKEISYALALRNAVKSSDAFNSLAEGVEDCLTREEIIEVTAGCGISNINVSNQDVQGRTVCTYLTAELDAQILKSIIARKTAEAESKKPRGFKGLISNDDLRILNYKRDGSFVTILYQAKRFLDEDAVEIVILSFDATGSLLKRHTVDFPLRPLSSGAYRWGSIPISENAVSFELKINSLPTR
jgi:hypothetical protein